MRSKIFHFISIILIVFQITESNAQQNTELLKSVLENNLTLRQVKLNAEYQSVG